MSDNVCENMKEKKKKKKKEAFNQYLDVRRRVFTEIE